MAFSPSEPLPAVTIASPVAIGVGANSTSAWTFLAMLAFDIEEFIVYASTDNAYGMMQLATDSGGANIIVPNLPFDQNFGWNMSIPLSLPKGTSLYIQIVNNSGNSTTANCQVTYMASIGSKDKGFNKAFSPGLLKLSTTVQTLLYTGGPYPTRKIWICGQNDSDVSVKTVTFSFGPSSTSLTTRFIGSVTIMSNGYGFFMPFVVPNIPANNNLYALLSAGATSLVAVVFI